MTKTASKKQKIEYGDWQTPLELANLICQKLVSLDVKPDVIIEPTCGVGNFIRACINHFDDIKYIYGLEYNLDYVTSLQQYVKPQFPELQISQADFFTHNWDNIVNNHVGELLVIGNFPWVTNSQQGAIDGDNLPLKTNIDNLSGLSALTGHSNFDISESMLRRTHQWFLSRNGKLAMLCKLNVARKFLTYLYDNHYPLKEAMLFKIDAKRYFDASVEACLLYCDFDTQSYHYDYQVFEGLEVESSQIIGHRNGMLVSNIAIFEIYQHLYGNSSLLWRSGIKHDCAPILELTKTTNGYQNGLGEIVDLEAEWVYPLLKGSDVANGYTNNPKRFVLITQKHPQESTIHLQSSAPKVWAYLERYQSYFHARKSRIYNHKDRFAMFGLGDYSFMPYKIAIASLYKSLHFEFIGQYSNRPIMLDDTIYFLGFDKEEDALLTFEFLQSEQVRLFLDSLIFWDEKRPIKTSILNRLKLNISSQPIQLSLL